MYARGAHFKAVVALFDDGVVPRVELRREVLNSNSTL
jgi:hypothetical protein